MAKGKSPMAADEGYCVKCKAKRKISNAQQVKMANGRPALKGVERPAGEDGQRPPRAQRCVSGLRDGNVQDPAARRC